MRRYFAIIKRYLIAIPVCVILAAVVGAAASKLTPNNFVATASMAVDVNAPDTYIHGQTTPAFDGAILATEYAVQIPTRNTLTFIYNYFPEIKKRGYTVDDLLKDIKTTTPALTQAGNTGGSSSSSSGNATTLAVITISATVKNEGDAIMLANDTAKGMQFYVQSQLQGQLNTIRQSLQGQIAAAQKQRASDSTQLAQISNPSDVRVTLLNDDINDMIHNIDTANTKLQALPTTMKSNVFVTNLAAGQGVQSTSKASTNAEYGAIVGFINGIVVVILLVMYDERLHGANQVKRQLGYAYIGGFFKRKDIRAGSVPVEGDAARQLNDICTNLRLAQILPEAWKAPKGVTLLVTSPYIADGKTTIATGMAASFARAGRSVLVIDGNVVQPSTHLAFGMNPGSVGLTDLLGGKAGNNIEATLRQTSIAGVWLLAAGTPSDETPLLLEEKLPILLTYLRKKMDIIIIDGPALLTDAISPLLSSMVDGVALVVDTKNDNLKTLRQSKALLRTLSDAPVGIILNRLRRQKRNTYYFTAPADEHEIEAETFFVNSDEPELEPVR